MNKTANWSNTDEYAFRDESDICMMIGKRVNANASTLVRLNHLLASLGSLNLASLRFWHITSS